MAASLRWVKGTYLKKCRIHLKSEDMSIVMTKAVVAAETPLTHSFCQMVQSISV